ncbi:MAG: 5-(carboxyamino)imidazole ribonucleotide mutase [Deltaproteobacteria bacterium]|nr:MAG: 5-(carboxyamino)imidazole ribonucleotide mutase [Deltaproteobacteria bacterium]
MKVLIVGGGGREHALAWKISKSPRVTRLYCAPGNAGIAEVAECIDLNPEDVDAVLSFARKEMIDLTVVGPEAPLAAGIVDQFEEEGLRVFGVSRLAAELEASKSFAKQLMKKYGIPTADGAPFTALEPALTYIRQMGDRRLVVKADGLAAGKGVVVCDTMEQAEDAVRQVLDAKVFGTAGETVLIEERLEGEEASFLAITDGETVLPLPTSQDHKRVYDRDRGPNTGGMGAYSPAPVVDRFLHDKVMNEIMIPTVRAMKAEGRLFKGILYAGLMIDRDQVNVLEFNVRFGDPEAQPLLMRVKNDWVDVMEAAIDGNLKQVRLDIDSRAAVCVVMAAGGYPGSYGKGSPISGLFAASGMPDVQVFHAGTTKHDAEIVPSGGRVLGVTALGDTIEAGIEKAYAAVKKISWDSVHYRTDIGQKALVRLNRIPRVGIVMGSDSDLPVMLNAVAMLKKFDIPYEMTVASAHRTPEKAAAFAGTAMDRGIQVIIAGAGQAAHLAGAMAAATTLPIIGVPIYASALQGLDALLSTVQMPPGVPVATVAIGKPGATNAGVLAAQIIAIADPEVAERLKVYKADMEKSVQAKAMKVERCG